MHFAAMVAVNGISFSFFFSPLLFLLECAVLRRRPPPPPIWRRNGGDIRRRRRDAIEFAEVIFSSFNASPLFLPPIPHHTLLLSCCRTLFYQLGSTWLPSPPPPPTSITRLAFSTFSTKGLVRNERDCPIKYTQNSLNCTIKVLATSHFLKLVMFIFRKRRLFVRKGRCLRQSLYPILEFLLFSCFSEEN